jgi:hypothetical protein
MMGPTHRIWGAHHGLIIGTTVGAPEGPYKALITGVAWSALGYVCATLPDVLERLPGGDMPHRGPTHWPEPPLIIGLLAFLVLPWPLWVLLGGAACGVLSHWSGDMAFGKAHVMKDGDGKVVAVLRPQGAPYLFGRRYVGWGIKVDSKAEKFVRSALYAAYPVVLCVVTFLVLGG